MDIPLGAVSKDLCRYPPPLRPVLFPVDTLAFFEERNQLVLVTSSNFFESDFPLTVGVVAESFVVMRGSGLPPASAGTRDRIVRFHEGHSPPLPDQMAFHSESGSLVGQVRSSVIRGSWWCFFLIVTSVVLGCVEFCWAGDPSFLDFNVFATNQRSWNIKKSLSAVNSLPYPIIQPVYSSSANSSSFSQLCLITPTSLTMSNLHQQPRPCPYSRPVRFTVVNPYPPPPYRPVASHQYGLRPRLPLTYSGAASDAVADRDTACVASGAHPFSVQSVDTPEWSFRVNRPDPFSPSSPINPFVVDHGTPETPPVRVRPSVGGSQATDLTVNRVVVDRGATPPPAPRPRNASTPPSFESLPVAARWSSPSGASAVAGSSSGTPAPTRVTTPPVQGAYDPDDYHLLQRDQICLLLAPAPPLAPYDRYRFGPQASASRLLTYACGFVAYCHDFPTVDQAQLDRRVDIFEGLAQDLRDA
ncbi:hypothetical protein PSTG_08576 [Puccinia striiformis f. sp. tritici PST-78]|uniref:Uncharacterized protein n=1 Tax=Puccinia striiformis f. sp. tritici PST-78 TaxID=1165861 RepID=A0A0L0VGK0_9BASI|nr:hypothetical protein PSTG_08576 [Puccinia striiformis f. sp. tritici PST-78]